MMEQQAKAYRTGTPGKGSRKYELVSTVPEATIDIKTTLALCYFGSKWNTAIVAWNAAHRTALAAIAEGAKLVAVIAWYTQWRDAAIVPILICCLPNFVCTVLQLSVSILQLLTREFEFWFASILNVIGFVVFSIELGFNLTALYSLLVFLSIQITIISDAAVHTVTDTARAGVIGCAYTITLALYALQQGSEVGHLRTTSTNAWRQGALSLLSNVAITLTIFIVNKTFKRRRIFINCDTPFVPLAVCRTQLVLERRDGDILASGSHRVVPKPLSTHLSFVADRLPNGRVSVLSGATEPLYRVRSMACRLIDSRATLIPWLCTWRRLPRAQFIVLNTCGVIGFGFAGLPLLLLFVFDIHERAILYPCAAISLVFTIPFCTIHAAHYHRDILLILLRNFDFWFLTFQFGAAQLCIANLLGWDYRCLCMVTWSPWFNWVLVNDAMLACHARKLHFKRVFASLVLFTVLFGIVVVTFSIALDPRDLLPDHELQFSLVRNWMLVRTSTKTALGYRFATIWLWTVRLVSRLAKYHDAQLVFLRGTIECRNPGFEDTSSKAPAGS